MNYFCKRVRNISLTLLAFFSGLVLPISAHAQIEEIIVTAEKRVGNAQDIPIAISAFDASTLKSAGIDDVLDIQFSVPNVVFTRGNFTDANLAIRGVGNSAVGVSADSGAGVHVNGVYLNAPRIFETEFFDVERVEMLRGPQGTLYGRNTTAGVLNVITAKPDEEFGADIGLTFGNYNTVKLNGMVNLPLSESVSQRFAVFSLDRDGYTDNIFTGNDVDDRDMYAVRSTTLFNLSEDIDATLMVSKFREDDSRSRATKQQCIKDPDGVLGCLPTGLGFDVTNSTATTSSAIAGLIGLLNPGVDQFASAINPADFRKIYTDFDPRYFVEETLASLEFNWRFEELTFTSLTGYSNAYIEAMTDYDWTVPSTDFNYPVVNFFNGVRRLDAVRDAPTDTASDDHEQFSQEFRLTSDSDSLFNFTVGLFAMNFETENHYTIRFPVAFQFGQLIAIPEEQSLFDLHTKSYQVKTWALFGEGYWQLSDATKLTFGLRYTDEEKKVDSRQILLDRRSSLTDPFAHQRNDWQEVTGKIAIDSNVDLSFTDDTLLYATFARGYKGGGFNPPGAMVFANSFEPEYVNSIEFGAKNSLFDNTVQVNIDAFFYDYEGLQVSKIFEQTSINENIDSTINGFEVELMFAPNENWRGGLNIAYLKAEIGDFQTFNPSDPAQTGSAQGVVSIAGSNCLPPIVDIVTPSCVGSSPGVSIDLEGHSLPNSPEFSVNANIEYIFYWGGGYSLSSRLQYYWQDEYFSRIFNTKKDAIDSWSMIDAQFTLRNPADNWNLQFWIKNIKDDDYVTGHHNPDSTAGLFTNIFVLEPRTFGVSMNYSF